MKRLRSSDDLDSYNEKGSGSGSAKDLSTGRSSRSFYYKSDSARKGLVSPSSTTSSSCRYDRDRSIEDESRDRESSRLVRKRSGHDFDGSDRRKGLGLGFDRYSSREGYTGGGGSDRSIHRSESFSAVSRREFPKGFRSERERCRRRFGSGSKDFDEGRGSRVVNEERLSGSSRSSPKGLRDVKSPRDDGKGKSSSSKSRRSSPSWSKDSGSEQSRSVEVGKKIGVDVKNVEIEIKSAESGSSSEMEEGELEPEPQSDAQVGDEDKNEEEKHGSEHDRVDVDRREVEGENLGNGEVNVKQKGFEKDRVSEKTDVVEEGDKGLVCGENFSDKASINGGEVGNSGNDDGVIGAGGTPGEKIESEKEETKDMTVDKSENLCTDGGFRHGKAIDLEAEVGDDEVHESDKEFTEENEGEEVNMELATETLGQNLRDKGKGVAVSPVRAADSNEDGIFVGKEPRKFSNSRVVEDTEGPSTRAFELFSTFPDRKVEKADQSGVRKPKDEKLALGALDLSLSLPNVLLPIGASRETAQDPGSPSRSIQSFNTFQSNSNGFTASMSFSGSQSFFHNPSCSLTQNSLDMDNYEQSVHSRPIFQGIDQATWQAMAHSDSKAKDIPLYLRAMMNGNSSSQQSQALQNTSNGQALQGNSKLPNGLEKQLSFHKQLTVGQTMNHEDTRSPLQSTGSHDNGTNYSLERKRAMRDRHGSSLHKSNSQKEQEQFLIGGADFVETIIGRIVSDPIHVMARKFHEMTGQSSSCLKESIREIMLKTDKQGQLFAIQRALQNKPDLTLDVLLKCHRSQLEILVALKVGLPEYLKVDNSISSSDLAEVFLNLRCKNLNCRSPIPVDECDCKVCMKRNGFCSACMCLVCSKFDMASNTCSWVGCDVCLHWCHADCALRESYIRNGRSATGAQGTTEMQFHCVACDHPSEMFGFVKEVFQHFAKEWTAETFRNELQYVKRIFSGSKDVRGRQLHEVADQILIKLTAKANLSDVYTHIMAFLTESESSKFSSSSVFLGKEQGNGRNAGSAGPTQDSSWLKSSHSEKTPQLERSPILLPSFNADLNDNKHTAEMELRISARKDPVFDELETIARMKQAEANMFRAHTDEPVFDELETIARMKQAEEKMFKARADDPVFNELESVVRMKQAEAKMFQAHADEARKEAEGLKRIAIAKNEKIEEEYTSRIAKLRLVETEETRKHKYEELQALERAHREYLNMKMRMEADIKDLLLKMESTKQNISMRLTDD
ncbi:hypothetical protein K2173_011396 [Erythroxylum novogranatense]|uniref:Protein OBERON 4 n=1 Tax=Erythroxylum novogranatense TaxID=1862640 RepID=A0AAV8S9F5_9ROSI|nr:hypothetical protein K2173_011396 [Erythroxylum novogranatense]